MQPFIAHITKQIKSLFTKKTWAGLVAQLYNPNQSDELKAFSAALGIFMGIIPIWGFQTIAAIFLAVAFKLNKALVVIFSQVSFPAIFPLVIWLSFKVGGFWVGEGNAGTSAVKLSLSNLNSHLAQYLYGSFTLAVLAAITIGVLTFLTLKAFKLVKQYRVRVLMKEMLS